MFFAEEDLTLHITRGDTGELVVTATNDTSEGGETPYIFKAGDVLRLKVYEKKNCENVILQKDFGVEAETEFVTLELTETDTRIGDTISKPVDYWYEIELNPYTEPQTIVGYDDDGAKIFKLYPEGKDTEVIPPTEEELGIVDSELSLTSQHAIQNQAVARAFAALSEDNTATQIKEQNGKRELTFWVGTQDEFNALDTQVENCFYIISKSTNLSDLKATVNKLIEKVNGFNDDVDNLYADVDKFKSDIEHSNKAQIEMIENKFNENKTIVEEYHEDKVHYYRFGNGLEIELGEIQKVIPYSNNSYGFELKKIAEDDLISFNISLSSSQCVRASEDYLIGNRIAVVLMSISQDGTVNDTDTSVGIVYGSYIAFGLSGLGVSKRSEL